MLFKVLNKIVLIIIGVLLMLISPIAILRGDILLFVFIITISIETLCIAINNGYKQRYYSLLDKYYKQSGDYLNLVSEYYKIKNELEFIKITNKKAPK